MIAKQDMFIKSVYAKGGRASIIECKCLLTPAILLLHFIYNLASDCSAFRSSFELLSFLSVQKDKLAGTSHCVVLDRTLQAVPHAF